MGIVLRNALLVDIDPPRVESGGLRIDGGGIVERSPSPVAAPGDEIVDCGSAVVMAGLVNGHTHLYSSLAVGMPPPPLTPRNFLEILQYVWWRLDQALDAESIEMSATIGALQALRCGTTTLIDHHASPNCIEGSLDLVRRGIERVGLRGILCYETTDRHGAAGRDAGIAENRRFIERCRRGGNKEPRMNTDEHGCRGTEQTKPVPSALTNAGMYAGLVGAHASFTLDDDSLDVLARLSEELDAGVHIHVAEDPCDEQDCRRRFGRDLVDRLAALGLLKERSILAHGTHLDARAVERVNAAGVTLAHNPRSNMNNAVGHAPIVKFRCPVMLGTDGIGGDMFGEARAAWFISRHQHAGLAPDRIMAMLAGSARRASAELGMPLGKLQVGAAADLIVTDYVPFTELTTANLSGHMLFGMSSNHVRHVLVDGRWRLRDRIHLGFDEASTNVHAQQCAAALWRRMAAEP